MKKIEMSHGNTVYWILPLVNLRVDVTNHTRRPLMFAISFPRRPGTATRSLSTLTALSLVALLMPVAAAATASPDSLADRSTSAGSIEMIRIKAGTFTMGSPFDEPERNDNEYPHLVTLSRDFWLGTTEVTQHQWQSVMGNNPAKIKGEDHPVEMVSWNECARFCNALSQQEGLTPAYRISEESITWNRDADGYRLPTEAEWEYACRAGTTGPRSGDLDEMAVYALNSGRLTRPVGTRKPNPWGLHDMYGNVWEWCWDQYQADYGSSPATDPTGPKGDTYRIQRGGSWHRNPWDCRSAKRNGDTPVTRRNGLGFRVARFGS